MSKDCSTLVIINLAILCDEFVLKRNRKEKGGSSC